MGNRDLNMAPHGVFQTDGDDDWIAIAIQTDEQLARLASLAEIAEPNWQTFEGRKRGEDARESRLELWTRGQNVGALEQLLQLSVIPAHRLVSIE